jgi:hypothetical protein
VEHTDAAHVAALLGAVGVVLVLVPRNRFAVLAGYTLLGLAAAGLIRSLVGDDDLELLFTEPTGLALIGAGAIAVIVGAIPLVRYPSRSSPPRRSGSRSSSETRRRSCSSRSTSF